MPNGCVHLDSLAEFSMETQSDLAYKIDKDAAAEKTGSAVAKIWPNQCLLGAFLYLSLGGIYPLLMCHQA
ncbi:hypothetical protein V1951_22095, partial [Yersinia sp. 2544 StPb PI]|uniref:hypothetical protein n=1 Tax=Yersinia sp. 2544 StPb PI TaxID=3117409 RepID=UPI003B282B81